MYNYSILNVLSFLTFIQFVLISLLEINRKKKIVRYLFAISLFLTFISYSFFTLYLLLNQESNYLSLILYLTLVIILFIYFACCMLDFSFVRLRFFFIPYFLFFILICKSSIYLNENISFYDLSFYENKLLSLHIIISLLSYSFLTVSSISSTAVLFQQRNLKLVLKRKINFFNSLPSIYEGEKITIRLLITTQFFLLMSLVTGFYYHKSLLYYQNFFSNEKFLLSTVTFLLICVLLLIRYFFGLTGKKIFSFVLLSFLFINIAYFGLKFIN